MNLDYLLANNSRWAKDITAKKPDFFHKLAKQQRPKYLWIGCSDSRVPANEIVNLPPGEVFVHRNIANIVVCSDLNFLSVLQYAVEILSVEHIIVCGHYGCGGVSAALEDADHGLIDNWLEHIRKVARIYHDKLDLVADKQQKIDLLCELNVITQMNNVYNTSVVKRALKNHKKLHIHGWIYSINDGILRDLNVTAS